MQPSAFMLGQESPAAREGRDPSASAAGSRRAVLVGAASALGIFFLSHPYWGIVHDAELYVGRAVADGDPGGLGRDIFFALEGQSAFSIYPRLSGAFLRWAGPGSGALVLTLAGLTTWLAALALFGSALVRGRLLWAALVVTAVVPSYYGQAFRYAEQFATPRLPAEAMVLAGLGALASGRHWLALAAMALAATIHPLMALPGLAVSVLALALRDRRWLLLPVAAGLLVAAAGLARLPLAERLFRLMDPAWAEALQVNAYLFPTRWPETAWAVAAAQAATILLALPFVPAAGARRVLVAIIAVAILGVAVATVAADRWLVLLVVQVQPWRALWLLAVAGALTFPIAAVGLWRSGPGGQVALGCLVLGWLTAPLSAVGCVPAIGAVVLARIVFRRPALITDRVRNIAWIAVALLGALTLGQRAILVAGLVATKPADASVLGHMWLFWVLSIPVAGVAVCLALRPDLKFSQGLGGTGAPALVLLAALSWDDRSALTRIADRSRPDPELARLLPAGTSEILWLKNGAGHAWRLAGRPNWVSYMQGASIVFSPELGRVWQDRMDRLVAAGLADGADRYPWSGGTRSVLSPSRAGFEAICRAPDGPSAIIVPLDGSIRLPDGLGFAVYRLPAPSYDLGEQSDGFGWRVTETQAVATCPAAHGSNAHRTPLPG